MSKQNKPAPVGIYEAQLAELDRQPMPGFDHFQAFIDTISPPRRPNMAERASARAYVGSANRKEAGHGR